ncbi:MAG TPA: hypothetical protein VEY09_07690 [Pyrinomonadaceae bacterium]|nr:hypothetical protein [Pyrinomonadaceae bacterium]
MPEASNRTATLSPQRDQSTHAGAREARTGAPHPAAAGAEAAKHAEARA